MSRAISLDNPRADIICRECLRSDRSRCDILCCIRTSAAKIALVSGASLEGLLRSSMFPRGCDRFAQSNKGQIPCRVSCLGYCVVLWASLRRQRSLNLERW